MYVPEARIEETPAGSIASGTGWFVLSLIGARGFATDGHGVFCPFESPDADFEDFGINVHVIEPGERSALYHAENVQEGFLVLAGECIAVVEDQERALRAWDFFHCPGGTAHMIVGAGTGPSVVLAVGARGGRKGIVYPVDALALAHDAGVERETTKPQEAYRRFPSFSRCRYEEGWLPEL